MFLGAWRRWPSVLYLLLFAISHVVGVSLRTEVPGAACYSCVPTKIREQVAVGFNLGQSYSLSVVYHNNGTASIVEKIPASDQYKELIQRLMSARPSPYQGSQLWFEVCWLFRTVAHAFKIARPPDDKILAEVIIQLKDATEKALHIRLDQVAVAVPWLPGWENQFLVRADITDALEAAGLQSWFGQHDPLYLTEAHATLAANGRSLCPQTPFHCFFDGDEGRPITDADRLFFVSLTNDSLYTSFALTECFFTFPRERGGVIDSRYGLAKLPRHDAAGAAAVWAELEAYLVSRLVPAHHPSGPWVPKLVLVTGEGAENADFLSVMRRVVDRIPDVDVELLVSRDPGMAAAKGAAMLSRLYIESAYYCKTPECCEFYNPVSMSEKGVDDKKTEL